MKQVTKIRLARISLGMTQKEFSNLTGVGVTTLVKMESDKIEKIKVENLRKVAKVLDTTVSDLFFSDENKEK